MVVTRQGPQAAGKRSRQQGRVEARDVAGLSARRTATKLLGAVIDAGTPLDALTDAEHGHPHFMALEARDRMLVRAILTTALRFRRAIAALIEARLDRPLPANAHALVHTLHVAAAQILFLDVPDRAAVDIAVEQAKADPRTARFAALVNAVLRGLSREKDEALARVLAATREGPDWLAGMLEAAYGREQADAILAAHRVETPTDFTVKADPELWAERLGGIVLPFGTVRVETLAAPVPELPGFAEGRWWVQDAAASLPARLMGEVRGLRVADLCAAPGGKTAQLAAAGADVTAIDLSKSRLKRLGENMARLGLTVEAVAADIATYEPAEPFDAVLLDAPCSSTGTIRRHPDVAWTKTPQDVDKLATLQRRLLDRAVKLVRPGGTIVFSNCSLAPAEGEELLAAFLRDNDEAALDPISGDEISGIAPFVTAQGTLRTTPAGLPGPTARLSGLDGFFAARLRRKG